MACRAVNLRLDERDIMDIKNVAAAFHMTFTSIIREALNEYLPKKKNDPYYRLTANAAMAPADEAEEILSAVESLSEDDLSISSTKKFRLIIV